MSLFAAERRRDKDNWRQRAPLSCSPPYQQHPTLHKPLPASHFNKQTAIKLYFFKPTPAGTFDSTIFTMISQNVYFHQNRKVVKHLNDIHWVKFHVDTHFKQD